MSKTSGSQGIENKYSVFDTNKLEEIENEERDLLKKMLDEAESYLGGFKWCRRIKKKYLGFGIGGVFAVLLFEIENKASPSDDLLWVIVGDIPPAYLVVHDGAQTPQDALKEYVDLMREWVAAVEIGGGVEELVPVNVDPTPENAQLLKSRLDYLQSEFLEE